MSPLGLENTPAMGDLTVAELDERFDVIADSVSNGAVSTPRMLAAVDAMRKLALSRNKLTIADADRAGGVIVFVAASCGRITIEAALPEVQPLPDLVAAI